MDLDVLLRSFPLNNGTHDGLIKKVMEMTESRCVENVLFNGYYKVIDKKNRRYEGDVDLLQLFYDPSEYDVFSYKEVPFNDSTLLLYEMKSSDTVKNYRKAKSQLVKSRDVITRFTDYDDVVCFYAFWNKQPFTWRVEKV